MQLKVRDSKGLTKVIEVEPTASVTVLRELVTKEFQASSPTQIRLINKGKLLSDENTVQSSGLEDNDLIMVLVTKSKEEKGA